MKESVLKTIHQLADIKNQINHLSPIDKDLLLQEIRNLYVAVLEVETIKSEEPLSSVESILADTALPVAEEEPITPSITIEEPIVDEVVEELSLEEPIVEEPANTEAAAELLFPEEAAEEPAQPIVESKQPAEAPEQSVVEPEEPVTPAEPEAADLFDDLLQFLPKEMTEEKQTEKKVAELEEKLPAEDTKIETKPVEPVKVVEPEPKVNQEKRSLNDLLQAQHEENSIFNKMQQSKINDLLKAISLNDKFLFIKELFNGKGEDFSLCIQKLNNCANLDEAFEELEIMKKHYFWESTSAAYLSLCDLIRRRYIN